MDDDRGKPWEPPSREALIDRQLREAMADGSWDDLPFRGERIPMEDDSAAGDWALAHRMLRNAGIAPPWIEADKEYRHGLALRDALIKNARGASRIGGTRRRARLTEIVDAVNRAADVVNAGAPSDRQHRRRLDLEAERATLEVAESERR